MDANAGWKNKAIKLAFEMNQNIKYLEKINCSFKSLEFGLLYSCIYFK